MRTPVFVGRPHAAVLLLLLVSPPAVEANDPCAPLLSGVTRTTRTNSIKINGVNGGRPVNGNAMSQASSAWNSACSSYHNPQISLGAGGDVSIDVRFMSGSDADNNIDADGECGTFTMTVTGGRVTGGTIWLFRKEGKTGNNCNDTNHLRHELGHAFGFDDSPCGSRIMGDADRNIVPQDCQAIDDIYLTTIELTPPPDPGGGCLITDPNPGTPTRTALHQLSLEGRSLPLPKATPGTLERVEEIDGMFYLREEWMVLETGADGLRPLAFSTPAFATRKSQEMSALGAGDGSGIALLVEAPVHPYNERHIALPEVGFDTAAVPYLGPAVGLVVQVDLGEDRQIRDSRVLHATAPVPKSLPLLDRIGENLRVGFASAKQHRVLVYAVFDLRDGQLALRDALVVRPKCCCSPICV